MTIRSAFAALLMLSAVAATASAQRPLKVYISADMEGVAGVVSDQQLGPTGFEYARFREFMTAEVLAAIAGARAAGATEILVSDSHGNGQNLLIERLPADVRVVRSWPRPNGMMEGIDSTFHAALFIGYHSSSVALTGVRAHTMSSARITKIALNGTAMPEGGINAAIAGHYGVPVVFVSGDDAAVAEVRSIVGDVEGAVVKTAISFHAANTMTPEAAQTLIRERTRAALARLSAFRPYRIREPVTVDLALKSYRPAELLAWLPFVTRTGSREVRWVSPNAGEAMRILQFITNFSIEIDP